MDIAFLLVNKSTANRFSPTAIELISSFINPLIETNYDFRLALIEIGSADAFPPIVHPFTRSIGNFTNWLLTDQAHVAHDVPTDNKAICKARLLFAIVMLLSGYCR
jgi:hypothetical protein